MTYDLFPANISTTNLAVLADKISDYRLTQPPLAGVTDKWLLASNLQKAIRRGLTCNAVASALALQAIDSRYFWRRLLVIAYEDVGVANIGLCHDLLKSFRREAMHLRLGPDRVAGYFAEALAKSMKSRALCDAIAMLEFDPRLHEHEKPWFSISDTEILDAVNCHENSVLRRVAALRHICGYRENNFGSYRLATPVRKELMREVCRQLNLTEMESALFIVGSQVTEAMNVALPLVANMARNSLQESSMPLMFEGEGGILYAGLDRHTRLGKACFAEFAASTKPLSNFFRAHPKLKPVPVLGVVLFIIEGSRLNRWAVFQQSDSLRRSFERIFLQSVGVHQELASEFLGMVTNHLPDLNELRRRNLITVRFGK